jgi:hypothetical protein
MCFRTEKTLLIMCYLFRIGLHSFGGYCGRFTLHRNISTVNINFDPYLSFMCVLLLLIDPMYVSGGL